MSSATAANRKGTAVLVAMAIMTVALVSQRTAAPGSATDRHQRLGAHRIRRGALANKLASHERAAEQRGAGSGAGGPLGKEGAPAGKRGKAPKAPNGQQPGGKAGKKGGKK